MFISNSSWLFGSVVAQSFYYTGIGIGTGIDAGIGSLLSVFWTEDCRKVPKSLLVVKGGVYWTYNVNDFRTVSPSVETDNLPRKFQ